MSNRTIAVIGQGFVGGSLTTGISSRGYTVLTYDKTGKCVKGGKRVVAGSVADFVHKIESDGFNGVYFVCVPTPMFSDGECDTSIVEDVLKELSSVTGERVAVVKSTVPPGSTYSWNQMFESSGLQVVFNPEFLTEANAVNDFMNQNRIVLGGAPAPVNAAAKVYEDTFPDVPIITLDSREAEMVKYFTNCFLAMKVSFANEMYDICTSLCSEDSYERVMSTAVLDARLGQSHWSVPGPPDHEGNKVRGFGGHCIVQGTSVRINSDTERMIENLREGDNLLSTNSTVDAFDYKTINEFSSRFYTGDIIKFNMQNGKVLMCTPEHLIPVERDGKLMITQAQNILQTDSLFVVDNE